MKIINAFCAVLLLAGPARAIELSLEENRAERGSVGFVDMKRLFSGSPDAARAKESFEELVRQAEERVNLKKAESLKLRQDLEAVKAERDALAKSTATVVVPAQAQALPAAVKAPEAPPTAAPTKPTFTSIAPVQTPAQASTAAVKVPQTPPLALPGMTPLEASPAAAPEASTATPPPPPPPAAPSGPTVAQRLLELDGRIIALQADLDRKEEELKRERQEADKGLIDVEGRKTDQVLARLYRAINEVSHKEGVSVVVDKSTILYGHPAVDLTDKVLKYLKGSPTP